RDVEPAGKPRSLARSGRRPADAMTGPADHGAELASLMYHEVTDDQSATGFQRPAARRYAFTTRVFGEHLARVEAAALRPGPVTAIDFARPGRHVLLTFDDCGKSALYAGEELARRGWQGHFFAVTGRIGERTFLDGDGLRT